MKDRALIKFAREFREGILDGGPSDMMCAAVCWPLVTLLNMHGVKCRSVESDLGELNHIWIKLDDGRALDPTIDQFNYLFDEKWPRVYLGARRRNITLNLAPPSRTVTTALSIRTVVSQIFNAPFAKQERRDG